MALSQDHLLKRALKVGIPASFERSLTFGSFMLFTVIIAHYGTEVLAGYQIGLRVEGLAFMPGIGFTIAAMALMGQGLGAKILNSPEKMLFSCSNIPLVSCSFSHFL